MVRAHAGDHGGRYREVPQAIWGLAEAGCPEGTNARQPRQPGAQARPRPLTCPCDMSSV
jgi:hypothetical protein